jgi:VanZ family protein
MRSLLNRWGPPLAWMGLIFFLSSQPDLPSAPEAWLDLLLKKGAHALAFGVLAWLYLRALRGPAAPSDRLRLLSLALAVVYAISDEAHQSFVPGRTPRAADVLIDTLGAVSVLLLGRYWPPARPPAPR